MPVLAKYIRLSSADEDKKYGDKHESNSVTHQRMLLDSYISSHLEFSGYEVLEFLDDGRSGTNFTRPGVLALLGAAQRREIDCIVVKDFSRFGRSYLDVGNYLERVFPALGIRFISLNDEYDSKNYPYGVAGDVGNGLLALIYDLYSRELSQKIKDSRRQYASRGQCVSAYPIYGYAKSPENRRAWVIDPEPARVVRQIFEWFLEGKGQTEICDLLSGSGTPTPAQWKREAGIKRQLWNSDRIRNEWGRSMVARILRDERYTGKLIALKTSLGELGNIHSAKPKPKDEWITIPGAFEPIICQETFNSVQERLTNEKSIRQGVKANRTDPFRRKLKCGLCGYALARHNTGQGTYFSCKCESWNMKNSCRKIQISEPHLTQAVLSAIRSQAQLAKETGKRFDQQKLLDGNERSAHQSYQKQVQERLDAIIAQKRDAYLRYDQGEMSLTDYRELCAKLNLVAASYQEKSCGNTESIDVKASATSMVGRGRINDLGSLVNIQELDRDTVDKLIHRIEVYGDSRIEISWNFDEGCMKLIKDSKEAMMREK